MESKWIWRWIKLVDYRHCACWKRFQWLFLFLCPPSLCLSFFVKIYTNVLTNIFCCLSVCVGRGGCGFVRWIWQIDREVGCDHLFKKSVLLVKAWSFYESRILGSHHGLLSTFAVTSMVLLVLNIYFEECKTPLGLFSKFLEYYSKFDWMKFGVSVCGPVSLSDRPHLQGKNTKLKWYHMSNLVSHSNLVSISAIYARKERNARRELYELSRPLSCQARKKHFKKKNK